MLGQQLVGVTAVKNTCEDFVSSGIHKITSFVVLNALSNYDMSEDSIGAHFN